MDVVVDTNKIIAATLKDGMVRKMFIILSDKVNFYVSKYVFLELEKYKKELEKRLGVNDDFLDTFFKNIFTQYVKFIDDDKIISKGSFKQAYNICKTFDIDDTPIVALALELKCPIWSNDSDLKEKQKVVTVLTTQELVNLISSKKL
ncbi:MAG: PIN domain-containing protein [Candidatus Asgardarchaeia archaeon]